MRHSDSRSCAYLDLIGQAGFLWNAGDLNIPQRKKCWNSMDPVELGKFEASQDGEQGDSDKPNGGSPKEKPQLITRRKD